MSKTNTAKTSVFYISGLHCPSCEILIEKKLSKQPGVLKADVSLSAGTLTLNHQKAINFSTQFLNDLFSEDGYSFTTEPKKGKSKKVTASCPNPIDKSEGFKPDLFQSILIALIFMVLFFVLNGTGFTSLVSVGAQTSLPVFLLFGLLAGFSSCAALVGGIILSLSKQWMSMYSEKDSLVKKLEPHLLFSGGRLLSYAVFGAILGGVGNFFRFSPTFTASTVILVSGLMIVLGLQMIGVKAVQNFRLALPKSLTKKVSDESNFQGRFAPALMGALTFFLPCGFTITAQALALASGNPIQGALILFLFALGTVPGLLAIGLSSVKMYADKKRSAQFSLIAGFVVLFFALFNINSQLSVLGVSNFSDLIPSKSGDLTSASADGLAPVVNGKQLLKMEAYSYEYSPNKFKIKAGQPVRFEITDKGTSGCTNAVISRGLFQGQIDLVPGTTSVKEFTAPDKPGLYKFSCWMGMVSGTIEVVGADGKSAAAAGAAVPVESGAKGCGCGGGSGSCGGSR